MAKINSIDNKTSELTIDPGASGDSFVQFDINGTGEFRVGVDDDDSDKFKISSGAALGSNDCFTIDSSGHINRPLTSCFSAYTGLESNITGDGTAYTIDCSGGGERFDQNSDFDGTSTFTAPTMGLYLLVAVVYISGLTGSHTSSSIITITSNRNYYGFGFDAGALMNSSNEMSLSACIIADMDASDTATWRLTVSGSTKVVDVDANKTVLTGCLIA